MNTRTYTERAHENAGVATRRTEAIEARSVQQRRPSLRLPGGVVLAFLGGWLLFGGFALHLPYSVIGQNTELRDAGFAIVVSLAAMSVLTTRSIIGSVLALACGVLLILAGLLMPHVADRATVNEVATGILVIVAAAATLDR